MQKKKNPWSDDDDGDDVNEDEVSDSDMDVISEDVAPREKRERKGKDCAFTHRRLASLVCLVIFMLCAL